MTGLDKMVRSYPAHPSKYIVVRMVIEVDKDAIMETMTDEDRPLTVEQMIKTMQREMEQIKQSKYTHTKLPDWFKAVDCAEIEENKEAVNG
jgi:hypothetical protein